ncbi:MAG: divalent-cation tolerance protein CutA [Pirellulales bacterium]|nr:divalent-cation tolerance protein CutA [Pirellulales bacterium]
MAVPPQPEYLQVVTTLPDQAAAEQLARLLVDRRLAACAQISGPLTSIYRWQGAIENASEWQLVLKTRRALYDELARAIVAAHPYEVPEVLAFPIIAGHAAYLDWVSVETTPG